MGIHFKLDDALVYERMASRGRSDDTPEAMKHRIAQFYEKTMPVIEHFEKHGELVTIDASQGIEEIAKEVLEVYTWA